MNFRINTMIVPGCALALMLISGVSARADLTGVFLGFNVENEQTTASTVSLYGTFFSADGQMGTAGEYTSGTLTYPGPGSPQALTPTTSGFDVVYQTPFLPDVATLQTDYPFGTYTVQAFGSGAPSSAVGIDYTANAYGNTPALTAGSYNSLQGLNPGMGDTVNFNGFTTNPLANETHLFFNVYDQSGNDVYNSGFLPSSTTSVFIPGGTFTAGTTYDYELIYDDRIDATDINGSGIGTQELFDTRTFGYFTTATPEPGYFVIVALGMVCLFGVRRRRLSADKHHA